MCYHTCLRLLGLMASTIAIVPLGLLQMRAFKHWVSALQLCPKRHLNCLDLIDVTGVKPLRSWRAPSLYKRSTPSSPSGFSHKLLRANGSPACFETLPPTSSRSACPSEIRQYDDIGLHKSPRRNSLSMPPQASPQVTDV